MIRGLRAFSKLWPPKICLSSCSNEGGQLKVACQRNCIIIVALLSTYWLMQTLLVKRRVLRLLSGSKMFGPKCLKRLELKLMYSIKGIDVNKSPSMDSISLFTRIKTRSLLCGDNSLADTLLTLLFATLKTFKSGKKFSKCIGMPFCKFWFESAIASMSAFSRSAKWFPFTIVTLRGSPWNNIVPVQV